jgi:hypothetical protein
MPVSLASRVASAAFLALLLHLPAGAASECDSWRTRHSEWIFCDDFESGGPLAAAGRYFEVNDNAGDFKPVAGEGLHGTTAMRANWQAGEVDAGNLKLGFGRSPSTYFSKGIRTTEDFREIYYRMYVRLQAGWKGNPYKLTRATVLAKSDWSQAMIAHLWGDQSTGLQLDPASCTDGTGAVKCAGYNDFNSLKWIGAKAGPMHVFDGSYDGQWLCVEAHVKLNSAGNADGLHEFWIGDTLEARREGLDFLGNYKDYGINAVFFENYWNTGSPQAQMRWFDNIVVSTQRIGCAESLPSPALLSPHDVGMNHAAGSAGNAWALDGRRKLPSASGFLPLFPFPIVPGSR